MANEKVSELPTVANATLADVIYAIQGGVSVQETLQQVANIMLANTILNYPGNPNTHLAGSIYQLCYDTVDSELWVCTTTGTDLTAVWTRAGSVMFPIPLSDGGTGASLIASNGGIVYSNASAMQILAATTTANQIILSGASGAPSWSSATYPSSTTANQILFSSAANTISGLPTANSGVLITSGAGVPSIGTTLPIPVQLNITETGTVTVGTWNGSLITPAFGGTGVNNSTHTLTLGGNTAFSGAFTFNGTLTGNTSVTFPTTGTLATTAAIPSLPLSMANGGTGANLTANNGAIPYSNSTTMSLLAPSAVAQSMFWGNGAGAPSFAPYSMPATITTNGLLYGSSSTVVNQLTTANDSVLTTDAVGNPLWLTAGTAGAFLQTGVTPAWSAFSFPTGTLVTNELLYASNSTTVAQLTTANNSILATNGGGAPSFTTALPAAVQVGVNSLGSGTGASNTTFWRGDGTWATPAGGGGGTVNAGTANQIGYYATTGSAISGLTNSNSGVLVTSNTGVPSILAAGTVGQVLTATTAGTPFWGVNFFNATLPTVGGVLYANTTSLIQSSAASTLARSMLWGNTTGAPTFAPYSMPATVTANGLLFASSTTAVTQIATANSGTLVTSSSGVPTIVSASVVRQSIRTPVTTLATGTTLCTLGALPITNTQGDQYISQAITPTISGSVLEVEVQLYLSSSVSGDHVIAGIFSGGVNAVCCDATFITTGGATGIITMFYTVTTASLTPITFTVRMGGTSVGTRTLNPYFGSTANTYIKITEWTS